MKISVVLLTLLTCVSAIISSDNSPVKNDDGVQEKQEAVRKVRYRQKLCVVYGENVTASRISQKSESIARDNNTEDTENKQPPFVLITPVVMKSKINVWYVDGNKPALKMWTQTPTRLYFATNDTHHLILTALGIVPTQVEDRMDNKTKIIDSPMIAIFFSENFHLGDHFPICKNPEVKHGLKRRSFDVPEAPSVTPDQNDATTVSDIESWTESTTTEQDDLTTIFESVTENSELEDISDILSEALSVNPEQSEAVSEDEESVTEIVSEVPLTTTEQSAVVNISENAETEVGKPRVRRELYSQGKHSALLGWILRLVVNSTGVMEMIPPEVITEIASHPAIMKALFASPAESREAPESQQPPESNVNEASDILALPVDTSFPAESEDQSINRVSKKLDNKFFVVHPPAIVLPRLMELLTMKPGAVPRLVWPDDFITFESANRKRRSIPVNNINEHGEDMQESAFSVNVQDKEELQEISFKPESRAYPVSLLQIVEIAKYKVSTVTRKPGVFKDFSDPPVPTTEHTGGIALVSTERPLLDAEHNVINNSPTTSSLNPTVPEVAPSTQAPKEDVTSSFPTQETVTAGAPSTKPLPTTAVPTEAPSSESSPAETTNENPTSEPLTTAIPFGINPQDEVIFIDFENNNGSPVSKDTVTLSQISAINAQNESIEFPNSELAQPESSQTVQSTDLIDEPQTIAEAINAYRTQRSPNIVAMMQGILDATAGIIGDVEVDEYDENALDADEDTEYDA